jgi:hypothetical protein
MLGVSRATVYRYISAQSRDREPGPLRAHIRPPRRPALHDRQMPISDIHLDSNLATDTLGHPASAPPLHSGHVHLRQNTHPTSVQSVLPVRRCTAWHMTRVRQLLTGRGGNRTVTENFPSAGLIDPRAKISLGCPSPSAQAPMRSIAHASTARLGPVLTATLLLASITLGYPAIAGADPNNGGGPGGSGEWDIGVYDSCMRNHPPFHSNAVNFGVVAGQCVLR